MIRPRSPRLRALVPAVLSCALAAVPALAVTTQSWVREGDTLRAGTSEGMVITPDGWLAPGPKPDTLARPETALLWSVLADGDVAFVGAGENTGVLRVAPGQPVRVVAPIAPPPPPARLGPGPVPPGAQEGAAAKGAAAQAGPRLVGQEVFSVVRGAHGEIWAATGPNGGIYQVDPNGGAARELARPDATYVWALLPLPDGTLAVATGLPGRVLHLDPRTGATRTLWQSAHNHVRALALSAAGKILAGTAGGGELVELDGKGGAFTLWDSNRPETVAIAVDGRGTIWAAFAGPAGTAPSTGGGAAKPPAAKSGGTVNITVKPKSAPTSAGTDLDAGVAPVAADEDATKGADEDASKKSLPRTSELPVGGGAVLRIGPNEEPETTWADDKETPLCLLGRADGGAMLGTGGQPAHVWWFDREGRLGLFDERKESRAVSALAISGDRVVAALSNPAAVVAYGPGAAAPARWISDVFDARVHATLGHVHAFTEPGAAKGVAVAVRAGNTAEPGPGWTDWQTLASAAGPPDADGANVKLPRARFFQVRVEAAGAKAFTPLVSRVSAWYRGANRPPRVENVEVLPRGVALRAIPPPQISSGEIAVVPPPRGPEMEKALGEANMPWRSKRAYEPTALTVTWEGRDPDNDDVRYTVEWCRDPGGPCTAWQPLADDLDQTFYSFDSRTLPDGVYRFRVTASDAPDNPVGEARTTQRISDPVPIDNTPPVIDRAEIVRRANGDLELHVAAHDPGGRLVRAEVTREPGVYEQLMPADGVGEGSNETWTGVVPALKPGQALLVRVVDAAGNDATRRAESAGPSAKTK